MAGGGEPFVDMLDLVVLGTVVVGAIGYFLATRKPATPANKGYVPAGKPANGAPAARSTLMERMKDQGKELAIFYGTQTGTAEDFCNRIAAEAKMYGFGAMVLDLEEVDTDEIADLAQLENSVAIFCVATYGEGDPTDNAIEFHQWLKDDANGADLTGLRYTVFALGNSTYEHYQAMGRLVDKKLKELGGERVFKLGEGDDDKNIEEDFLKWKKELLPALCKACNKALPDYLDAFMPARQYAAEIHTGLSDAQIFTGEHGKHKSAPVPKKFIPDMKNPQLVPVRVNRELFKEDAERSCRHIELDISGTNIKYLAGDHVAVFPQNPTELVEEIGNLLKIDLDTVFSLKAVDASSNKKSPFPCPTTYRTALTHYVDISHVPKPHHLKELSQYAEGDDKAKLLRLASEEGQEEYHQYILHDLRTICQLLAEMPTLRPPIDHILEMLPRLQCRYYSISSSPKVHPTSIHLTAVVVEYDTPAGRHAKGVATCYLRDLKVDDPANPPLVPIYVRHSTFRLPRSIATPIVMVGPGTGLAPMRGFIQDRAADSQKEGKAPGPTVLYYGCRNRNQDFLYAEELYKYKEDGVLTGLELAFSREQAEKVYVTHLLRRDKKAVWEAISAGGHIYVCGEARNMAKDVHTILDDVVAEFGNMTGPQAEKFIQDLQAKGRYAQDVWS